MTDMLTLAELERLRTTPATSYADLRRSCEDAVVRWQWATGPVVSLRPLDAERGGWPRGKVCKGPPAKPAGKYEIGLDASGDLRVVRQYTQLAEQRYETFVAMGPPRLAWHFDASPNLKTVADSLLQIVVDGGRTVATVQSSRHGLHVERYRWGDGRVVAVAVEFAGGAKEHYVVAYREGLLHEVRFVGEGGGEEVVYAARPPSLAGRLEAFEDALVRAVLATVARNVPTEPVFCVGIVYGRESPASLTEPELVMGLEHEREAWRRSKLGASELWNPARLGGAGGIIDIEDPALADIGRGLSLAVRGDRDVEAIRKAYVRVAASLMGSGLRDLLPGTEDFVAVPLDLEVTDLAKNLRAVLGTAGLAARRERGETV